MQCFLRCYGGGVLGVGTIYCGVSLTGRRLRHEVAQQELVFLEGLVLVLLGDANWANWAAGRRTVG